MSSYIPEEMMVQIFSRLPPKSLLRFKCLSKSWNSLISSPEFIWQHAQQSNLQKLATGTIMRYFSTNQRKEKYLILLSDASADANTVITLGSPFNGRSRYYCRIVGLCNGVLCLSDDLFGHEKLLVLWNPRINICLTLPEPLLCCDSYVVGFGSAIKTRDYKVVRIAYAHGDGGYLVPPKVEVYALSSGIWKKFNGFIPNLGVIEYLWTQAVVCGKVHWTAYKRTRERRVENLIMVFDLNEEIFQELSLPEILVNEPPMNLNAAECRESLAVYQYDTRDRSSSCFIWVMKQYGDTKSWSKEFNVSLGHQRLGMIVGFRNDSSIILTDTTGTLTSYNRETQKKERHGILGTSHSFYVDIYKESLVLLDKGELLSPLDVSYEETTDDNEDEENDAEKMAPRSRESWMHKKGREGILGTRYSFYFDTYKEGLVLLDKAVLLSPLDVSYEETTDDDEDEENDAEKMAPRRRESHMHQYLTAFLGERNINP